MSTDKIFSVADRERVHERVLHWATSDGRVEALFGYAVHHTLRARFCIERGRWWQAEYWISGVRDYALHLACRRRGLPAAHGRGFDDLPAEVHELFTGALVASLTRAELLRALGCAVRGLLAEAEEVQEVATKVAPQLERLIAAWNHLPHAT